MLRRNSRREATANSREPAYPDPRGWPGSDPIPAPRIVGRRAGDERPGLRLRVNWVPFHNRSGPRFPREAGLGASRYWPRDHSRNSPSTVLGSRFAVPCFQVRGLVPGFARGFRGPSDSGPGTRVLGSRHTGPLSDPAPVIVGRRAGDERLGLRLRVNWAPFHDKGRDLSRRVTAHGIPVIGPISRKSHRSAPRQAAPSGFRITIALSSEQLSTSSQPSLGPDSRGLGPGSRRFSRSPDPSPISRSGAWWA